MRFFFAFFLFSKTLIYLLFPLFSAHKLLFYFYFHFDFKLLLSSHISCITAFFILHLRFLCMSFYLLLLFLKALRSQPVAIVLSFSNIFHSHIHVKLAQLKSYCASFHLPELTAPSVCKLLQHLAIYHLWPKAWREEHNIACISWHRSHANAGNVFQKFLERMQRCNGVDNWLVL